MTKNILPLIAFALIMSASPAYRDESVRSDEYDKDSYFRHK